MSTETIRLIRDREKGVGGVWRWGKREIVYLLLRCHHLIDSCIKMVRIRTKHSVYGYCLSGLAACCCPRASKLLAMIVLRKKGRLFCSVLHLCA